MPPEIASAAVPDDLRDAILQDCLEVFPVAHLRVQGVCMQPRLFDGEIVHLADARAHPPRIGDVVLVRRAEGLRLHRLIWGPPLARWGSWRTQADRSPIWDARLSPREVLATVRGVEREGRVEPVGGLGLGLRLLLRGLRNRLRQLLRPESPRP